MAIYVHDMKIDLTIKHYEEKQKDQSNVDLRKTSELELKEQNEFKNLTLREALKKLVELVF